MPSLTPLHSTSPGHSFRPPHPHISPLLLPQHNQPTSPSASSLSGSNHSGQQLMSSSTPLNQQTRTITFRHAPSTYLHLHLAPTHSSAPSSSSSPATTTNNGAPPIIDALTLRAHIASALQAHAGLTGAAVQVDILDITDGSNYGAVGTRAWVRCPAEDADVVRGALASSPGVASGGVRVRVLGVNAWMGGALDKE